MICRTINIQIFLDKIEKNSGLFLAHEESCFVFFLFVVKSLFLAHEEVIIDLYVEKIVVTKKKVEKIVEKVMGFGMIIFTETDQL